MPVAVCLLVGEKTPLTKLAFLEESVVLKVVPLEDLPLRLTVGMSDCCSAVLALY